MVIKKKKLFTKILLIMISINEIYIAKLKNQL